MQNFKSFKLWSRGFGLFLILIALDMCSKRWAMSLGHDIVFGPISFGLSKIPPAFYPVNQQNIILRVIHYATFLGPLMLLYFFFSFQFLNMEKAKKLNLFLSIWVAGIVGNILDRVIYGPVIEFIQIDLGFRLLLNLASLMALVGAVCFSIHIYRHRKLYIFSNQRKLRILQSGLQYDYVGKILFVCLFLCLTISIFSYTFMKFYLTQYNMLLQSETLKLYLIQVFIISGLYLLIIVLMAFHFSSRFVGPLYGFEKYIEKLEAGDVHATFRVRENDHHKNLEAIADKIKQHWKN